MKVVRPSVRKSLGFVAALFAVSVCVAPQATAQAPYLLPYTINSLGQGTSPTIGQTCTGTNGVVGTAYDTLGDGCPISSGMVVIGASKDLHDVGVDAQGNIYFIDTQSNGFVRRIDSRSGVVTAYAGTASSSQPTVNCGIPTPTLDKYGDGCQANDGKANATPTPPAGSTTVPPYVYTANFGKARGIAVGKNGDVFMATYTESIIHKISLSTGTLTVVAGLLAGGTATAPKGYIGSSGYTGDGTQAGGYNGSKINSARGVAVDLAGNVYIADTGNNVIRKVTASTGIISTVVGVNPGNGTVAAAGSGGDNGPATAAMISGPEDVEVDAQGNIFIADFGNSRVRMVYNGGAAQSAFLTKVTGSAPTVGYIYTVAGSGTTVFTAGTVVPSTSIAISNVRKIGLDNRGNLYIADNGSNVIWFVDITTGYIRVLAGEYQKTTGTGTICTGGGTIGDGCPATQATLSPNSAMGVAVDAFGNVLISDSGDQELRRASTNQTFAATATGNTLTQTLLVHYAAGDAPQGTYTITGSTDFTVVPGTCTTNGDMTQDCQVAVTFAPTRPGTEQAALVIASTTNGTTSVGISGFGVAATVAFDPGATSAFATGVKAPQGIAQDGAGNTYVADTGNNRILRYTSANTFTIFAGTGVAGYTGDSAPAALATLKAPRAVTVARDGSILIADTGNNVIRSVSPVTGVITTVAGAGTLCAAAVDTLGDGCPSTQATLNAPAGLIADNDGNTYVADTGNNVIRELTPGGYMAYVAGGATTPCAAGDTFGNGCAGSGAIFSGPTGLAVDLSHNVYIADTGNSEVRKLTAGGIVAVVAGTGVAGASGNGGPGTGAQLSNTTGIAVDAAGNTYIADTGNSVIRLVNGAGIINTTAGTLSANGTGTLPGSAFNVQLNLPSALLASGQGRLLIVDSGNNRIFADDRGSVTYDFGRTNQGFSSPVLQIQESSTGSAATTLGSPLFTVTSTTPTGVNQFTLAGTTSNGCAPGAPFGPGASCLLAAQFTPTQLGVFNATYTESTTTTKNSPVPFITLMGTGAILTPTTSATTVTTPATGSPTYAVPFVVTTTVTPQACNTAAPSCFPSGTVTFSVNGGQVGLPVNVVNGVASQTISGLSVGTYTIVAVYSGDNFYASGSAPAITVTIAKGITKATVAATPATVPQFANLTLSASVTGPITTSFPTGTISFMVGNTLLGTTAVNPINGTASLSDIYTPKTMTTPVHFAQSFGLLAGVYQLTSVYSGDLNYAASTSAPTTLTISPQGAAFIFDPTLTMNATSLTPNTTGTAQGSTGQTTLFLAPTNTVAGTVTFACSGMPAHSDCTFSPTSLTFAPTTGAAVGQSTQIVLFTDVPDAALQASSIVGWPILLTSLLALYGFRRKLRRMQLLAVIALFGVLAGGSLALSGCAGPANTPAITPPGVYNVTVTVTGSNAPTITIPIVFTVTAGVPGQL